MNFPDPEDPAPSTRGNHPDRAAEHAILVEDERDGTLRTIVAHRDPSGTVTITGEDLGAAPREIFGGDEYEYSLTVRPPHGDRVWQELRSGRFTGTRVFSDVQAWLEARSIPFDFWSRVGE